MEDSILTSVVLPVSLAVIMFGMGLSLVIGDFRRVFKYPKAAFIGLSNQLILLPLIGFALALIFNLSPAMAVGLMIIAACPGGPTSNLITHISKGDIALSISLTAISSLITVFTIPIILSFSLAYFTNDSGVQIELPIIETILQIMVITIIPVSIGMIIRHYNEKFADKMERPMRIASTVIFIAVLTGIILANRESLVSHIKNVGTVTLLLNIITMTIGYYSARFFSLNTKQSISITIESGIQNGTLAIVIATTILKQADMSIPPAVYSLLMFFTSTFLMWKFGRRKVEADL
ncbi:MAG: bile acid:sodium symporter family protein [Bacteroidales bacterium]|nr:bile acid:sodium symporter family protein [Bacteroidales bacterium]